MLYTKRLITELHITKIANYINYSKSPFFLYSGIIWGYEYKKQNDADISHHPVYMYNIIYISMVSLIVYQFCGTTLTSKYPLGLISSKL